MADQLKPPHFDPSHPIRDQEAQYIEWIFAPRASGLLVFGVEPGDAMAMRRKASVQSVPVRVVDTRLLVGMPGSAPKR
jgi:hypothetical protein